MRTQDDQFELAPPTAGGAKPAGDAVAVLEQAEQLFDAVIARALSKDSAAFVAANRYPGGE